jgi:hypothetical protein
MDHVLIPLSEKEEHIKNKMWRPVLVYEKQNLRPVTHRPAGVTWKSEEPCGDRRNNRSTRRCRSGASSRCACSAGASWSDAELDDLDRQRQLLGFRFSGS